METTARFFQPPRGSFFLFGPRGTGKSTWARETFPGSFWVDLLQPDVLRAYSARPTGPLDLPEEFEGAALEGLVVQQLRAWNAYRGGRNSLHYWRTRHGVEVDCVVYGPDGFWAVEVKNARQVRAGDVRGLRSFRDEYPQAEPVLVHRGQNALVVEGIRCVPCQEFLAGLRPERAGILSQP